MNAKILLQTGDNKENKIGTVYQGYIAGQKSTGSDISNCEDGTGSGMELYGT